MEFRQQEEWCWAAVAVSVASFFSNQGGPSGGRWQQCELVSAVSAQLVGTPEICCPPGAAPDCNKPWLLDSALQFVNHLAGAPTVGPCDYGYLQGEIGGNRPVGVRIGWDGGGPQGHFIVLTAYDDAGQMVHVEDPQYGPSDVNFELLRKHGYRELGNWTHTYPVS
jgi:hypothetical protein